jgi:tripartite-type tricarboxylate transporter receptor subunit TctC
MTRKQSLRRTALLAACACLLAVWGPQAATAQEFPTKPITLVIPVGAGGSHDVTARAVTSVAADYLGQPIIIQLKPGGGGAIGSDYVAKAEPDGYTLLFGGPGWSSIYPAIENRSKGPNDLEAVCRINYSPLVLATRPGLPYKTFKEMIAWAKANPGKLIYGNTGPWGQPDLSWKLVCKAAGIESKIVPYDGGGPAIVALLGGHVDVIGGFSSTLLPHIKAGKFIGLAVLDEKRENLLPDVPTAREEGVDVVNLLWRGVLAPKGTPKPIVDKLAAGFKQMCEDKTVKSMIERFGDEVQFLGPDEFGKLWRAEFEQYQAIRDELKGKQ